MSRTIQHKRSSVAGNQPDETQIAVGELALNFPDQTIYTKNAEGEVIELGKSSQIKAQVNGFVSRGDLMCSNEDGTVEKIAGVDAAPQGYNMTPKIFSPPCTLINAVAVPQLNKFLLMYVDENDKAVIDSGYASTNSMGDTVKFVGSARIWNKAMYSGCVVYDPDQNEIIVMFDNKLIYGHFGTSGAADATMFLAVDNKKTIHSADPIVLESQAVYDPYSQRFLFMYTTASGTYLRVAQNTGKGAITFGTEVQILNETAEGLSLVYDEKGFKTVMTYTYGGNAYSLVGTMSGSNKTITLGDEQLIASNTNDISIAYDDFAKRLVIAFGATESGGTGKVCIAYTSSRSLICGAHTEWEGGVLVKENAVVYDNLNHKSMVMYRDHNGKGGSIAFKVNGELPVFDSQSYEFASTASRIIPVFYQPTENAPVLYNRGVSPNWGDVALYEPITRAPTNLTQTNYIGVSAGNYSDGDEGTILTVGSVSEYHSGLTPGVGYYVQDTGTLATTEATYAGSVYAGTAVSTTDLLIEFNKGATKPSPWVDLSDDLHQKIQYPGDEISITGNLAVGRDEATQHLSIHSKSGSGDDAELGLWSDNTSPQTSAKIYLGATPDRSCYIESKRLGADRAHELIFATNDDLSEPVEQLRITSTGDAIFTGSVTSSNTRIALDESVLTSSMATDAASLVVDSDGVSYADLKLLLKNVLNRLATLES